jgi:hypothetical protein
MFIAISKTVVNNSNMMGSFDGINWFSINTDILTSGYWSDIYWNKYLGQLIGFNPYADHSNSVRRIFATNRYISKLPKEPPKDLANYVSPGMYTSINTIMNSTTIGETITLTNGGYTFTNTHYRKPFEIVGVPLKTVFSFNNYENTYFTFGTDTTYEYNYTLKNIIFFNSAICARENNTKVTFKNCVFFNLRNAKNEPVLIANHDGSIFAYNNNIDIEVTFINCTFVGEESSKFYTNALSAKINLINCVSDRTFEFNSNTGKTWIVEKENTAENEYIDLKDFSTPRSMVGVYNGENAWLVN